MANEINEELAARRDYINRVYYAARVKNLCSSQKEFAGLVKVSAPTLSQAFNGNPVYLTENLEIKVRYFAQQNGLEAEVQDGISKDEAKKEQAQQATGVFIPEETRAMFDNMAETIRIQAQMLAQFQGGAFLGAGAYAPKNYRTDGK